MFSFFMIRRSETMIATFDFVHKHIMSKPGYRNQKAQFIILLTFNGKKNVLLIETLKFIGKKNISHNLCVVF